MIKQRHVKPELTSRIARISRCEMGSAYRAPVQIGGRAHSAVQPRALSRKSRGAARLGTADNASPAPGPLRRPPRPVRGPVTGVRGRIGIHMGQRRSPHCIGAARIGPWRRTKPLGGYAVHGIRRLTPLSEVRLVLKLLFRRWSRRFGPRCLGGGARPGQIRTTDRRGCIGTSSPT